ncbi:MAG: radical SAM protein [Evtepia gabavorous]
MDLLEQLARTREKAVALDDPFRRRVFEALPAGGLEGRTRAMLKVEDGCTNFCAYCIIPYARGAVRSLPVEQAAAQARDLAEAGYRELVLTGIELSAYGRDLPERPGLAALIAQVCRAVPGMRVRLGSLEPRTVTEDFCAQLAGLPNLCPHFHLSLQSGCDATLARMKRRYTTERYLESVELLRRHFDRPALTTDLIVGFPGRRRGVCPDAVLSPDLRLCPDAHFPLLPPAGHPGRRDARADSQRGKGPPGPSGGGTGPGHGEKLAEQLDGTAGRCPV